MTRVAGGDIGNGFPSRAATAYEFVIDQVSPKKMSIESAEGRAGYLPGLDGIRTLAVGAVVAYHLGVPFFDGGLLGVSVFFTLSGYLITSLLLQEFERRGVIGLQAFLLRRARRLLPALLLMLPVVVVTTAFARPDKLISTARQAFFALLYVANWTTIAQGDDYFQRFAEPGPLDHLWSLAIEEQFYIVWPLLVFGLFALARRARLEWWRAPLAVVTLLLAVASTWAIVHLYEPDALNHTRAYEGTDARAAALLVGAMAALALPLGRVAQVSSRALRIALDCGGVLGLAGVLACIACTDEYSPFLYRGGELALSAATVALTVAAAHPRTLVARVLGVLPSRWLGARSYGIYLWHLPVVVFTPSQLLAERPFLRGAVQLGVIGLLAAVSFRLVEEPIRRQTVSPARWRLAFRALVLAPAVTLTLVLSPLRFSRTEFEARAQRPPRHTALFVAPPAPELPPPAPTVLAPGAPRTACQQLVHVGDSTSLGLVSGRFLPNSDERLAARYRAVGVERFFPEISGARSMVETLGGEPNAAEIVSVRRATGYRGCYVLALGTNDPANTRGDVARLGARIDSMIAKMGSNRTLWTTTKTMRAEGPYQNANMLHWNQAVVQACARHPNMRVYDWASEVEDAWFLRDGVHFNGNGCRERAARLARAVARAFPRDAAPASECVVHGAP